MLGTRINIMWEEQLVDPPTDYLTQTYNDVLTVFS